MSGPPGAAQIVCTKGTYFMLYFVVYLQYTAEFKQKMKEELACIKDETLAKEVILFTKMEKIIDAFMKACPEVDMKKLIATIKRLDVIEQKALLWVNCMYIFHNLAWYIYDSILLLYINIDIVLYK